MDGANAFKTAFWIKLPLIRKWVVYMLVLSFAAGTQLFVEPTVLGSASLGRRSQQVLVAESARLVRRVPVRRRQRGRRDLHRPTRARARRRGSPGLARKALRGRVMALSRRYALQLVGIAVLLIFTAFFFVPIVWLFLASDQDRRSAPNRVAVRVRQLQHVRAHPAPNRHLQRLQRSDLAEELRDLLVRRHGPCSRRCNSGRLRVGAHALHRPPDPACGNARRDDHAGDRARATAVSRDQQARPVRDDLGAHLAVRVLPFRRLPHVHLLLGDDSEGSACGSKD